MVRPEQIAVYENPDSAAGVTGRVVSRIFQGPVCIANIGLPDGTQLAAQVPRQKMPKNSDVQVKVTGDVILLQHDCVGQEPEA